MWNWSACGLPIKKKRRKLLNGRQLKPPIDSIKLSQNATKPRNWCE
jgi:hypothetical protein